MAVKNEKPLANCLFIKFCGACGRRHATPWGIYPMDFPLTLPSTKFPSRPSYNAFSTGARRDKPPARFGEPVREKHGWTLDRRPGGPPGRRIAADKPLETFPAGFSGAFESGEPLWPGDRSPSTATRPPRTLRTRPTRSVPSTRSPLPPTWANGRTSGPPRGRPTSGERFPPWSRCRARAAPPARSTAPSRPGPSRPPSRPPRACSS